MKFSTALVSSALLLAAPASADNIRKPVGRALMGNANGNGNGNGFFNSGAGGGSTSSTDPIAILEGAQCASFTADLEVAVHDMGELPMTDLFSMICTEQARWNMVDGLVGMDMGTKPRDYQTLYPTECNAAFDQVLLGARDVVYKSLTSASACETELQHEVDHIHHARRHLEKFTVKGVVAVIGLATAGVGLVTAVVTATNGN